MDSKYSWTSENIIGLIEARSKYKIDCNSTPDYVFQQIISELGLQNQASIEDAARLWESLITKYKDLSQPALEPEDAAPPSWEFFECMHEAMLSLPPSILEIEAPQITLEDNHHEETVEEEAARLEEVFRNGNIVDIQSVVHDGEDEDDKEEVIVEEFSSDEDEEDCEEGEEEPAEGCKEDSHQQEHAIVDDIWSVERILKLIALRGQKEAEVINIGHRPVFGQMLEQLGLVDVSTPSEARKKWSSLVRKYFQLKAKSGKTSYTSSENGLKAEASAWPFYEAMENVMQEIIKTSPDGGMKSRRSPEFLWSVDITKKFIRLRMEKQSEISLKGHNAVYQDILNKLGIGDKVSVMMARKKWNYLFKRYQDEEMAGGDRSWALMKEMRQVMKPFRTSNAAKLKSRASPEFLWPNDLTRRFIELRATMHTQFVEGGIQNTYTEIMEELGLEHILTPNQLRKKWNYLVAKYKELSCTTGPDGSVPAPHTWPFFDDMQKALQLIPEHLINSSKVVRVNFENVWTKDVVLKFIELKGAKSAKSTKKISSIFAEIIDELELTNQLSPHHARKKWNYLYNKYLDLSNPDVDEYVRLSWPFYSAMQTAIAAHPASYTIHRSSVEYFLEAGGEEEDLEGSCSRRMRSYACFLCGKGSRLLSEFFMFEQNQRLLHTQKNALEIISHLVGKKVVNLGTTTCLCSRCTNVVNEADSLMFRHDRIREEAQQLYFNCVVSDKIDKEADEGAQQLSSSGGGPMEEEEEEKVKEIEEVVKEEPKITYSKRGRKRKSIIRNDVIRTSIKTEPLDDVFESTECEVDFDDDSEDDRKRRKLRARGRGIRGRGRGKRKRGRPATRTTLIGRGLGGQYPSSNKRKPLPFKGPKIYHCSECKGEFKKYTELMTHRKNVHTVIDTSTLEVEETVLENGVVTYFNKGKANNSDTSHMCRDCDKLFLRKDDLWYHQEIAHTEGKGRAKTAFKDRSYDCEECGEKFLFKYKLKMHINSKHLNDAGQDANDFTCGECGCKLGSLPGLTFHMRKHHNKSLTYRKTTEYLCSDCGFMASSNKKLKEHQESHCGSSTKPKVQCEVCGKTVLKVSLKMHKVKMHADFKEQCDRCGERYATKTDLLRHINVVHLRILLYNCRYCGERFPTSDALRYHRVKFHEKPSFFCQVCGKCYKRVGELNTHIKRAHSDRRKAEACQYCGKEYYDRSGLRNHLVNKHSVPQEMTYSENYLRKKRVDGLPLAKHMERRGLIENKAVSPMNQSSILQQQLQTVPQQQIHHHQQQEPPHQQGHQPVQCHSVFPGGVVGQHPHLRVVDEAAEAARNLSAYHEMNAPEEESSLVVTEITESPQVEQAVLVDPINVPQGLMHHPQVAHMQPPMTMHPHMHHQMQHANMRLNVLYQMNMHQPGPSHLNM